MNEIKMPRVTVDEIIKNIKEEVYRRRQSTFSSMQDTITRDDALYMMNSVENMSSEEPQIEMLQRIPEEPMLDLKRSYKLVDFLNYHDEYFLRNAFRCILGREPDLPGFQHYIEKLRSGEFNKIEILGRIRYSPEGRSIKIKIDGLLPLFAINRMYAVPIAGYIIRLIIGIIKLPTIINNISRFECYTQLRFAQYRTIYNQTQDTIKKLLLRKADAKHVDKIAESIRHIEAIKADQGQISRLNNQLEERLQAKADTKTLAELTEHLKIVEISKADQEPVAELARRVGELTETAVNRAIVAQLQQQQSQIEEGLQLLRTDMVDQGFVATLQHKLDELALTKAGIDAVTQLQQKLLQIENTQSNVAIVQKQLDEIQRQILDHKRNILDQQRRLTILLNESRKHFPKTVSDEQPSAMVSEEDHLLDALYIKFEDLFRGTREDIKKRQSIYLPIIRAAKAGTKNSPIIDVGCGRGEWLELLKENELIARGVDHNGVIIKECREQKLDVIEADIIHYLQQLKPNSIGAVTCFHIIEHLPLEIMVQLFDETFRLLKPGGIVIYETPNPENLIVGACNFYLDPTHRNPLPPALTSFLLESRGFSRIEINRLHPFPENYKIIGKEQELINRCNELFYGCQDYAVIGYKV